jgi:radial spoke head protein 9
MHFRAIRHLDNKEWIEREDSVFYHEVFDSIDRDFPSGQWSIQVEPTGKASLLRNLQWLGYFSFHRLGSKTYGGVYIGEGLKNSDFPFMV